MFVSTTVLGFVPLFKNETTADTMAAAILDDCKYEQARLDAFVVMPEHLHVLLQVPRHLTGSQLMDRLKTAWANRILDMVTPHQRAMLRRAKFTLDSRTVWQRGFRGLPVSDEDTFNQKLDYIHNNPVARGLCARPDEYRWSSASLWENGDWKEELVVADDAIGVRWPLAIRDSLADDVRPKN